MRDKFGRFVKGYPNDTKGKKKEMSSPNIKGNLNFCAGYLWMLKEEGVFDEITDGTVEIDTIHVWKSKKRFIYLKPKIKYDKFSRNRIISPPEINRISYNDMIQLGFRIVSRIPKIKWFKGQNVVYKLVREGIIQDENYLLQVPPKHYIEYDKANKLIRIRGRNAGPDGFSEWLQV